MAAPVSTHIDLDGRLIRVVGSPAAHDHPGATWPRWARITEDDEGVVRVTVHDRWLGVVAEARLTGTATTSAEFIAQSLIIGGSET